MYNARIYIITFLSIFIFSCNRSQETAFIDLKNAFISWYLKANPLVSESYNQIDNVDGWRNYNSENLEEYFADLHRFFIELSQIDRPKLSDELLFEYLVLWSFLKNTIYFENNLNPTQWDFSIWTNKIKTGLKNINLECGTLTAKEENLLKSRLAELNNLSGNIIENLTNPVNSLTEDGINQITKIQNRILTFLVECESDSNIYERWDSILTQSHYQLSDLTKNVKGIKQLEYPQIENKIWQDGYEIYFGQFLEDLISIENLDIEINNTVEKMLENSLPIYLKDYDEPIWVSEQDTLQVIKTVFQQFQDNNLKSSELVEYSNQILDKLKGQFKSKYFANLIYPKFEYFIGDSSNIFSTDFNSSFKNNYRAKFYIPQEKDSILVTNEVYLEYYLINEIFPGKLTLQAQSKKSSKLVKLLQDSIFMNGWNLYTQDLILKSSYIQDNPQVGLLLLENKLLSILKLKMQLNHSIKNEIIIEDQYLFSKKSKNSINKYWFEPLPNFDFILLNEINQLKKNHLKVEKNNIQSFNEFIAKNGSHYLFVRQNTLNY